MNTHRSYSYLNPYMNAHLSQRSQPFQMGKDKGRKILIVEDDMPILDSLMEELSDRGFQVAGLTSTDSVFKTIADYKPEVLLVDYYLPSGDGLHIHSKLPDRQYYKNMVFILMSAYHHVQDIAEKSGVSYLEKPFDIEALVDRIDNAPKLTQAEARSLQSKSSRKYNGREGSLFWDIVRFVTASPDELK